MKDHKLEQLSKIQKLETPDYLLTRIEGALEEVQLLVPKKLVWVYASVFLLFISIQVNNFITVDSTSSDMKSYAKSIGISSNYSLYHE